MEAEAYLESAGQFAADSALAQLTKRAFKGINTDWAEAAPVLSWAQEFLALLGDRPVRLGQLSALKANAGARLESAAVLVGRLTSAQASLFAKYPWAFAGSRVSLMREAQANRCRLDALGQTLSLIGDEAGALVRDLERLNCRSGLSLAELAQAVKQMGDLAQATDALRPLQSIVTTPLLQVDPTQIRLVADWYGRGRQGQFSPADLMWIAESRQDGVRSLLRAGTIVSGWILAVNDMEHLAPDGRWWSEADPVSGRDGVGHFLAELDDVARHLPDVESADLTFNELSELLADLQRSDNDRAQVGVWDELLGEAAFDTDLALLKQTMSWMRLAAAGIPNKLLEWCLESETDARLHWLRAMAGYAVNLRESVQCVIGAGFVKREELQPERDLMDSRQMLSLRRAAVSSSIECLISAALDGSATVQAMGAAGAALSHSCTLADQLAAWEDELGTDMTSFDAAQVADHRRWAIAARSWGDDLGPWVLQDQATRQYGSLNTALNSLESVQLAHNNVLACLRNFGELEDAGPAGVADERMQIADLIQAVARLEAAIPRLLPWADCLREYVRGSEFGLAELMSVAAACAPPPSFEQLALALRAAAAVRQATIGWQSEQRLVTFRGHEHDRLRREIAAADASLQERNRARVADHVLNKRRGEEMDGRRTATPAIYGLLSHEEQKLRRHLPVRRLIERTGPALQEYCPCWLMTPMAVAQFLPPGKIDFDLIIMDEASQLGPEDAWGAIARGRQLVIVGDPKQMPPTDFFSTSVSEDEDESEGDEPLSGAKLDSILDTASNCLPHSWLQWHYRSRHQSLIAPANRFSYGDKLVLFPTADDKSPSLGIRHTFVPNAVTTTGRVVNAKEADAIVERIIQLAREALAKQAADRLSIGVVSMNAAQQECIQELLDARMAADAGVERALACLYEHPSEPMIVRNLENIQGDERDVIIISYTYGPNTPGGTPAQRFGPLNFDGGERRFNVLITRAKSRMEVFASIRSDQIQVTGKRAGVQHFHYFLKYAESGTLTDPGGITQRTPDSPFEEHVMAVVKTAGYQVEPQVGVAGYFIDMAVRDPRDPGRFILGIECDGATYHSSKAARDRDRLREQVLKDRGWKLYRIWSTDWFTNYEASKEALLVAVARTCEGMA